MCLYTRIIENPKYKPNKKNGGKPPIPKDERLKAVPIKCGNCIECRKQKSNEWRIRLAIEIEQETAHFITMTFNEESLKEVEEIAKTKEANKVATVAVRRFVERWRAKHKKSVKHWFITELGHKGTERLHLHGIIFTKESEEEIQKRWKYGIVQLGYSMNDKVINYVVKYVTKTDKDHPGYKPKILASPGIGGKEWRKLLFYSKYKSGGKTNDHLKLPNGTKIATPIYLRNKFYSEEEREELWLEKLNKGEMYIMGQRIKTDKISQEGLKTVKGRMQNKEIQKALEYAREVSVKRGYGNGDYRKKEYMTKNNIKKW
ncbi:replication initiation protein [Tortoise microvirus 11]|nr:replication initiation protein [Tortoise microvirus 11]